MVRGSLVRGAVVFALVAFESAFAPQQGTPAFSFREVMIPARDGVRLHTTIFIPATIGDEKLPFILVRTPYGVPSGNTPPGGGYRELAADGYIFVFQDIRGRYGSEGKFVMLRSPAPEGSPGIDEGTDTYDTIEWLLANVAGNNGKVGMMGVS